MVSAADGYSTLYNMLECRYLTAPLKKLHEEWPLWYPVVLVNYGTARDFSKEPSIVMLKPSANIKAGYLSSDCWVIRIFNYCDNCAPVGHTLVQVMVQSQWKPWEDIREDEEAYKKEKETTASQVLERLNDLWPGIEDQVEMTNVATPNTWWCIPGIVRGLSRVRKQKNGAGSVVALS